jgi:RNA polymerase sigma factor (sigma-70 family)
MVKTQRRTYPEQNLAQLLARAQQGESQARDEIFALLRRSILAIAKARLTKEDAEDTVQETLMVVHDRFFEFKTLQELEAFARGVLRNKIGNFYRKSPWRQQYQASMEEASEPAYSIDGELDAVELDRVLYQAIRQLKPECRTILLELREGFSVSESNGRRPHSGAQRARPVFGCRQALRRVLLEKFGIHL